MKESRSRKMRYEKNAEGKSVANVSKYFWDNNGMNKTGFEKNQWYAHKNSGYRL